MTAAALAGAQSAHAATTVTLTGQTVVIADATGVEDALTLTNPVAGSLRVLSTNGEDITSVGCTQDTPEQVTCANVTAATATLGGEDDEISGSQTQPLTADGGSGDDALTGSGGNDILSGGPGGDDLSGGGGEDDLKGNDGHDRLIGQAANDKLDGGSGDDSVLDGGTGADEIKGGTGRDQLQGGADIDTLDGGPDDDLSVVGGAGNDIVTGGDGNDSLHGGEDDDKVDGNAGNDNVYGSQGKDEVNGGDGHDDVYGESGDDKLSGGNGSDSVDYSNAMNDLTINLATGGPVVNGLDTDTLAADFEHVSGGRGADTITGTSADNNIAGNDGPDKITTGDGRDSVDGGDANDVIDGGAGDDLMFGGDGDDTLEGGAGDDVQIGGVGADAYNGGDDRDTAYLGDGGAADLTVRLDGQANDGAPDEGDNVRTENVVTGNGDDTIVGDGARNIVFSGGGADTVDVGGDGGANPAIVDDVSCGTGADVVTANNEDTVAQAGGEEQCETINGRTTRNIPATYDQPVPVPVPTTPAPDTAAARITLSSCVGRSVRRTAFLKGVSCTAAISERANVVFELLAAPKAPSARAKTRLAASVRLASRTVKGTTRSTVKLVPKKSLVTTAKRFTATLRITATDAGGNVTVVTRKVTVRT